MSTPLQSTPVQTSGQAALMAVEGHFVGLMSGTSLDGVDGVLARIVNTDSGAKIEHTLARASVEIPKALQTALRSLATAQYLDDAPIGVNSRVDMDPIEQAALAANGLTDLYLEVLRKLQGQAPDFEITAVGAHGQTIRHRPDLGFTLQILNGARLAALSEHPVICDFRSADLALGGQGAPLVPLFHESALTKPGETRIILNLGGIANISVLSGSDAPVLGFDTGPASTLLDAWCLKHRGTPFDVDGQWAAHGQCQDDLLALLMDEPFLQRPPPKSTGRELFSLAWLEHKMAMLHVINPASTELAESARASQNVQATLSRFSALSIAQACLKALATTPRFSQAENRVQVYACGGGVRNLQLMKDINSALVAQAELFNWAGHISLQDTSSLGLDPQHVEASAFAWLAAQRWWQRPLSLHQTTGSRRPHVAGALYLP